MPRSELGFWQVKEEPVTLEVPVTVEVPVPVAHVPVEAQPLSIHQGPATPTLEHSDSLLECGSGGRSRQLPPR